MNPQKQRSTFISYSRVNKEFAIKLALELRSTGFDIWLDQLDIAPGARWDDEVEMALEKCEIFMVIITPASIASNNVKDEIGYAIDTRKRILPILLENAILPLRLRRFQYVDFTSKSFDDGVEGAKQLLKRLIDEPTLPNLQIPAPFQTQDTGINQETREQSERLAAQQAETDRKAKEEAERLAMQQAEEERIRRAEMEAQRLAAERAEAERIAKEEAERLAMQQAEEERIRKAELEAQRLAAEKEEAERKAKEEAERLASQQAEEERIRKAEMEAQRLAAEKAEAERIAKEEAERLASRQAEEERIRKAEMEAQRLAAEKAEAEKERLALQKAEAERMAREKKEAERLAALKAKEVRKAREEAEKVARQKALEEQRAQAKQELEKRRLQTAASLPEHAPAAEKSTPKKSRTPLMIGIGAGALVMLTVFAFVGVILFLKPDTPGTTKASFVATEPATNVSGLESIPVSGEATTTGIAPTATKRPTTTPRPTFTPNIAKTQSYEDIFSDVQKFKSEGLIASTNGKYSSLEDYTDTFAQSGWLQYEYQNVQAEHFVYKSHVRWSTAGDTNEVSGCGIVFGGTETDFWGVVLDKSRIFFSSADETTYYEVGKTRGTGLLNFGNPAEANLTLLVYDYQAYVYVNDEFIGEYTLSRDKVLKGEFGYGIISGTNRDYGTRCEISNSRIWKLDQ